MEKAYVEQRQGGYYLVDSRVSLESVVFAFLDGLSPETIATECFPTLTLEQVYGAITYYLANRETVNTYLENLDAEFQKFRETNQRENVDFYNKLAGAKRNLLINQWQKFVSKQMLISMKLSSRHF